MNTVKKKLCDISDIKLGMAFKTAIEDLGTDGNAYLIQARDLSNGLNTNSLAQIEINKNDQKHFLKIGDILLRLRGPVFTAFIFDKKMKKPVIVNNQIAVIRANNNIAEAYYLLWSLNSNKSKKYFESRTEGSNIGKLSANSLREITLTMPPLEEQRKIAKIQKNWHLQKHRYEQLLQKGDQYFNAVCNEIQNEQIT